MVVRILLITLVVAVFMRGRIGIKLLDTAREYQWRFKSEIEITWPQGKENANEID